MNLHLTSFALGESVFFVILTVIALIAAGRSSRPYWRVAAVIFTLLLLLQPEISIPQTVDTTRPTVILVDNSGSMSVKEDGVARLTRAANLALRLNRTVPNAMILPFADELGSPLPAAGALTQLPVSNRNTDFTRAFTALASRQYNPSQVIVISDGKDTAGGDALTAAQQLGVAVNTLPVGKKSVVSGQNPNVRIVRVEYDETVEVNALTTIRITLSATATSSRQATVKLVDGGGQTLGTTVAELDGDDKEKEISIPFTPEKAGAYDLAVQIVPLPGETHLADNQRDLSLTAYPRRPKVLYLECEMRPEFRFLRRALARDPGISLMSLVQVRPGEFTCLDNIPGISLNGFPKTEADFRLFDAIILGNFAASELAEVAPMLQSAITDGVGLLLLPGGHTTGEKSAYAFDFLPGQPEHRALSQSARCEWQVRNFFPEGFMNALRLPISGIDAVKPKSLALTVITASPGGKKLPVLLAMPFGKGWTALFTGHDSWRWPVADFNSFWTTLVRRLLKTQPPQDDLKIIVRPAIAKIGETIEISALNPPKTPLNLRVTREDAPDEKIPGIPGRLAMIGGSATAGFSLSAAGTYQLRISGKNHGKEVNYTRRLRIAPKQDEFDDLQPDHEFLQRLAQTTNGKFYPSAIETANLRIGKELRIPLGDRRIIFPLLVICLLGEWISRKRQGLP